MSSPKKDTQLPVVALSPDGELVAGEEFLKEIARTGVSKKAIVVTGVTPESAVKN